MSVGQAATTLYETTKNTNWRSFDIISRCIPMKCISVGHRSSSSPSSSYIFMHLCVNVWRTRNAGQHKYHQHSFTSHKHTRSHRNVCARAAMIFRILFVDFYVSSFCVSGLLLPARCVLARVNDDINCSFIGPNICSLAVSRKITVEYGMW